VRATKRGVADWANGQTLEGIGLAPERIARIRQMNAARQTPIERRLLPVTVKTRLGYDSIIIEDWVQILLEVEPVVISLHGRTLRQMYTGSANWEAIGRAAAIVRQTPTLILGNGDIHTVEDARQRIQETGVHGVLVGRAAMGNPWLFSDLRAIRDTLAASAAQPGDATRPTPQERLRTARHHARLFAKLLPGHRWLELRKHLSWYCRDFFDAAVLRRQLVQTNSLDEVEQLIENSLNPEMAPEPEPTLIPTN
jgi:tRNA-dihydrouridine synthase